METPGSWQNEMSAHMPVSAAVILARLPGPLRQVIVDPASFAHPVQVRPLLWGIYGETIDSWELKPMKYSYNRS